MAILWQFRFKVRLLKAPEHIHNKDEFACPEVKFQGFSALLVSAVEHVNLRKREGEKFW